MEEEKSIEKKHDSLRVLIDTGCSHSIISKKYCSKFKSKNIKTYSTGSGSLTTKYDSKIHFTLPEFSDKKIINWTFSVANTEDLGYDAIIGRDLLLNLKINISFGKELVSWEGINITMRDFNKIRK